MNVQDIISHEPKIFADADNWNAFSEMAAHRDSIINTWYKAATDQIRLHFHNKPSDRWSSSPWDNEYDTKFFLSEFGDQSIFIGYGWKYEFHLYVGDSNQFDFNQMNELLTQDQYSGILEAFNLPPSPISHGNDGGKSILANRRHFKFSHNDSVSFVEDESELAWYAGNRTDEFVQQAIAQLEKFTKNEEITHLIGELNRRSKKQETQ